MVAAFVQTGEGTRGLPKDPLAQVSHFCVLGKGQRRFGGMVDGPFRLVLKTRKPDYALNPPINRAVVATAAGTPVFQPPVPAADSVSGSSI